MVLNLYLITIVLEVRGDFLLKIWYISLFLCLKDLKSSNIMENCIALIAVAKLVNKEMIPALLPLVAKLMEHKRYMFSHTKSKVC